MGHAAVKNVVEEMAKATEEWVAELTEWQSKQVEALIKANSEAIEKLMAAIMAKPATTGTNTSKVQNKTAKAAA